LSKKLKSHNKWARVLSLVAAAKKKTLELLAACLLFHEKAIHSNNSESGEKFKQTVSHIFTTSSNSSAGSGRSLPAA
jgi:hypothetical protein